MPTILVLMGDNADAASVEEVDVEEVPAGVALQCLLDLFDDDPDAALEAVFDMNMWDTPTQWLEAMDLLMQHHSG